MIQDLFLKILKKEGLSQEEKEIYPSPDHLLKILLLSSDELFAENEIDTQGSLRERVFEVVIQRFETLIHARPFLKQFENSYFLCPQQLLNSYVQLKDFLTLTQKHIGHDFPDAGKLVLLGVMVKMYPIFLNDDSPDLSQLMAELDDILASFKPFVKFFLV